MGDRVMRLRNFFFVFSIVALNILPVSISCLIAADLSPKCLPTPNPCELEEGEECKREPWEITVWDPINQTWTKYTGESHQYKLTPLHKKCQGKYETDKKCSNLPRYCKQHDYFQDNNCETFNWSIMFDPDGISCQEK